MSHKSINTPPPMSEQQGLQMPHFPRDAAPLGLWRTYTHEGFVQLFVISRNLGLHEGGNVTGSHHNSAQA